MNQTLLPHDKEAEQGVLGTILFHNEALADVPKLTPEMFFSPAHRDIFKAMLDLSINNEPIDEITVRHVLNSRGQLDKVGGTSYLAELVDLTPVASNIKTYSWILTSCYAKRNAITAMTEAITSLKAGGNLSEIEAVKRIFDEMQALGHDDFGKSIYDAVLDFTEWLENDNETPFVCSTGLDFDETFGGFASERPTIIGAFPNVGKTPFGIQVAWHAAYIQRVPTLIMALEQNVRTIASRWLAHAAGVSATKLRRKDDLDEFEWEKVAVACEKTVGAPLYIWSPRRPPSVQEVRAALSHHVREHGIKFAVVDPVTNMKDVGQNIYERAQAKFHGLKHLGREFDVAMLLMVHLTRKSTGEIGIKGGGDASEVSDNVIYMRDPTREEFEKLSSKGELSPAEDNRRKELNNLLNKVKPINFMMAKNQGNIGAKQLMFDPKTQVFTNMKYYEQGEQWDAH